MQEGVALAAHCIDTGKAMETLERFLAGSNREGWGHDHPGTAGRPRRQRVAADREANSLDVLQAQCRALGKGGGEGFQAALAKEGLSFLCEVKKASPSKGVIAKDFPYLDIARAYEAAGAEAISCLTEPKWFLGSDQIFRGDPPGSGHPHAPQGLYGGPLPALQARLMGADCVLLLCALLDTRTLADYLALCDDLGLAALVEAHDEKEVASAVAAGARIIGGNNRNLGDFSVNLDNAARLRDRVPPGVLYVAESGVHRPADVAAVRPWGPMGSSSGRPFMRAKDKSAMLNQFRRSV